jgi:hypothetical protein
VFVAISSQGLETPPERRPRLAIGLTLAVFLFAKKPCHRRFVASQGGSQQRTLLRHPPAAGRCLTGPQRLEVGQAPNPAHDVEPHALDAGRAATEVNGQALVEKPLIKGGHRNRMGVEIGDRRAEPVEGIRG